MTRSELEIKVFIRQCYNDILKREPDENGYNTYFNELKEGKINESELELILKSSAEYKKLNELIQELIDVTILDIKLDNKKILKNLQVLKDYLYNCQILPAPQNELHEYVNDAFYRFIKTVQMIPSSEAGKLLEIGGNPYFISILLKEFRKYDWQGVNFFSTNEKTLEQKVVNEKYNAEYLFKTKLFNVEFVKFPYEDETFDMVLFCEVIEHLIENPIHALSEIHRILKPNGTLVLTTPNVARASNIKRLQNGENIYDPYSHYGVYGRHNREYTMNELLEILNNIGFSVNLNFTKFVHIDKPDKRWWELKDHDNFRGDYHFISAYKTGKFKQYKPAWLFR